MNERLVQFRITGLPARVCQGVFLEWQGKEFLSGPLIIELDENSFAGNRGVLDYSRRRARAEFQIRLAFPELAATLQEFGIAPELTCPVRATIHSEGKIA